MRRLLRGGPNAALAASLALIGAARAPWGEDGHRMIGAAAAARLPSEMPGFFRDSAARLSYLSYEPDRWRSRDLTAMDQAFQYDHFLDLENVPPGALDEPDRWSFLRRLYRSSGLERPERDAGLLPYRILEMYQRLLSEWRLWRAATPEERPWIEQRIVDDAGVLGHYVGDGSQPLHATIHYDGWSPTAPNPEGFKTVRGFHARFESEFVRAHLRSAEVVSAVRLEARVIADVPSVVRAQILDSNAQVPELYRLDRDEGFDAARVPSAAMRAFTVSRLGVGAGLLRDLWWTAYVESGRQR